MVKSAEGNDDEGVAHRLELGATGNGGGRPLVDGEPTKIEIGGEVVGLFYPVFIEARLVVRTE